MKTNLIKGTFINLIAILLVSLASGEILKSDEHNYTFTVPDTWTVTFQNSAGFSVISPDKNKIVSFIIRKAGHSKLDSSSMRQVDQGMNKIGAQNISSTNLTLDGIPAFKMVYSVGKAPFTTSTENLLTIADGKFYFLSGSFVRGDVTQDSDIQKAFSSFHFLQPPKSSASFGFGSPRWLLAALGVIVVGLLFWMIRRRAA